MCTTSRVSAQGEVTVRVQIRRAQTQLTTTYNSFYYALPGIASVHPRYGPMSGGTLVVISGSALDVGNTENTTITIADELCNIM